MKTSKQIQIYILKQITAYKHRREQTKTPEKVRSYTDKIVVLNDLLEWMNEDN